MSKDFHTLSAEVAPETRAVLEELLHWTRAFQRACDVMDEAAVEHLGINRSDGRCLDVIQERGAVHAGELAEALGLSPGAITTLVDRLERDGLVRRQPDPADRRKVIIELTDVSNAAVYELYGPLAEGYDWLLELTPEQLGLLRDFMRHGTELNLKNAARARALPARERTRRRVGRQPRAATG
jgi:DNA-binding MarR family transcriptional regulator